MNQSMFAIILLFGGIMAFLLFTYLVDKYRRNYRVVGKSNTGNKNVPDIVLYENTTYLEAERHCANMNENVTELSIYYYWVEKQN